MYTPHNFKFNSKMYMQKGKIPFEILTEIPNIRLKVLNISNKIRKSNLKIQELYL